MKNAGKRQLAMLLCIMICISLLPVSALAEGTIEASQEGTITVAEEETENLISDGEFKEPEAPTVVETAPEADKADEETESSVSETPKQEETSVAGESAEDETSDDADSINNPDAGAIILEESESAEMHLAESGTCGDNLTWVLDDEGTLTIFGTGKMTNYSLAESPFYSMRSSIQRVVIEDGVTSIGKYAFYMCSTITEINIPEGITSVGDDAFYNCKDIEEIVFPESLSTIGSWAFYSCNKLTSLVVPGSVTSIGNVAFYGCTGLTTAGPINGGYDYEFGWTTEIPDNAFSGCSGLKRISLPVSTSIIGEGAFNGCRGFKTAGPINGGYDYEFGWTTEIPDNAFSGCSGLTNITIPETVTSIGDNAFYNCIELTHITIPENVTSIGWNAFNNCSGIISISIPATVVSIGGDAFSGCSGLKTAGPIGGGYDYEFGWTTTIPANAFRGCSGLTGIIIPDSIKSIGDYAFLNCSMLTSIIVPASVTRIGRSVFADCTRLRTAGPIGGGYDYEFGWITAIPEGAFSGCSGLTKITIPKSVSSIGSGAFNDCNKLKTAGPIGGNYNYEFGWTTEIPENAFSGCAGLTSVTIPESITSIGNNSFSGCNSLTYIVIPASVTNIGYCAFAYCTALKRITFIGNAPNFSDSVFYGGVTATAYYPEGDNSWTEDVRQNYDGNITWVATCQAYSFESNPKTLVENEEATEYTVSYRITIDVSALIPSILEYFTVEKATLAFAIEMDSRLTPGSDITIESGALTGEATVDGNTVTVTLTGENIDGSALASPVVFTCTGTLSADMFVSNDKLTTTAQLTDATVTISGTEYTTDKTGTILTAETYMASEELVYDPNGGEGGPGTVPVPIMDAYEVNDMPLPTHADKDGSPVVFIGWTAEPDTKIYERTDNKPDTITTTKIEEGEGDNNVVYAVYGTDEFSPSGMTPDGIADVLQNILVLTYDANGGTGAPSAAVKEATVIAGIKNAKFTIASREPSRKYYKFKGWAEEKNATTAKYKYNNGDGLDDDLTIHKDTTLYAVWEQNPTYTLYFNANGGEDAPEPVSGLADVYGAVSLTIPSTRPKRTGYTFLGWGTSRVGSAAFQPGDNVTIRNGDVTLYAIWQKEGGGDSAIRLNKTELTLIAGRTEKLIVTDGDGNRVNASWSSTDNDVATINSDGTVAAKKAGKITITATYNGASASCQVRVLFKDVTDYSLFYFDAVYNMVDQGVIGGYDDGTFKPNGNCNRAAVVTFLWRLAKCPEPKAMATFSDMPTNNEDFCKAISWAAEQGITTGYAGNLFKPWNTCNRAAIVTFLWRYADSPSPTKMATFKDMPDNEDFCKAISWAAEKGITTGWDDNTFRPWNTCNRLAVASFLDRYSKLG